MAQPEQRAREEIDRLLQAAGWRVCKLAEANIHAARGVAIREFPLDTGFGFDDYLLYVDGKAADFRRKCKAGEGFALNIRYSRIANENLVNSSGLFVPPLFPIS